MARRATKSNHGVAAQKKLVELAQNRVERFVTFVAKFLVNDDPEVIRYIRVRSRRLEQTLRVLAPRPKQPARRKIIKIVRGVRQHLGPCRNLDVNMRLVESRLDKADAPDLRESWQTFRMHLQKNRQRLVRDARRQIAAFNLALFIERTQKWIDRADVDLEPSAKLEKAVKGSLTEWDEAYEAAAKSQSVKRLHALRIATKRLRYRAELAADIGKSSVEPRVEDLKQIQAALGEWHDRSVLIQCVNKFIGHPKFVAKHPELGNVLLAQIEQEQKHNTESIQNLLSRAAKLRSRWDSDQATGARASR